MASVGLDDVFDDGESQSGAPSHAGTVFLYAIETLEDVGLIVGRNPRTIIRKGDRNRVVAAEGGQADVRSLGGTMAEGVLEEIGENLLNPGGVGGDAAGVVGPFGVNRGLVGSDGRMETFEDGWKEIGQLDFPEFKVGRTMFQPGDMEEIGDEKLETFAISLHDEKKIFCHRAVVQGPVEKRFHRAGDNGQRGAKFMRDIGDKVPPHTFQIANLGHIVKYHHGAGNASARTRLQRAGMDLQVPERGFAALGIRDGAGQLDMVRVAVVEGPLDDLLKFVLPEDFHHGAFQGRLGNGKHAVERLVDEANSEGMIGNQDAFDHAGKNGAKIKSLVGDLAVQLPELLGNFSNMDGGVAKNSFGRVEEHGPEVSAGETAKGFPQLDGGADNAAVDRHCDDGDQPEGQNGEPEGQEFDWVLKR